MKSYNVLQNFGYSQYACVYTLKFSSILGKRNFLMIIVSPVKILFHFRIYACHMIIMLVPQIFELASVYLAQSQYNAYFSS